MAHDVKNAHHACRGSCPQNGRAAHVKQSESPRLGAVIDRFRTRPVRLGLPAYSHCITTHACMLSPGPAAGALPPPLPLLPENSTQIAFTRPMTSGRRGVWPTPTENWLREQHHEGPCMQTPRCAGVSCVVRMKGAPGKDNASSWADVQQQCGDAGDRSRACHTATLPHSPPAQLPISHGPGTDLLLTCTLPKFRVLSFFNTTGMARMAYLTSRDADQTDGEGGCMISRRDRNHPSCSGAERQRPMLETCAEGTGSLGAVIPSLCAPRQGGRDAVMLCF